MATTMRHDGVVGKWDGSRGWGFIKPGSGERDVFVHFSGLSTSGERWRNLEPGQRVTFEMGAGPDGRPCAVNVEVVS